MNKRTSGPRRAVPRGQDRNPRGPRRIDYATSWHSAAIKRRLHTAGMTTWELADLLGVHEHQVDLEELPDLPVRLWLEVARRLDLHPADIIRGAAELFELPRITAPDNSPDPERDHDALTVITALAHAGQPLDAEDLADALDWPHPRVAEALQYARTHRDIGGALVLRAEPPDHFTATARMDLLSHDQHDQLVAWHNKDGPDQPIRPRSRLEPLDALEAETLLTVFWRERPDSAQHHAATALRAAGLLLAGVDDDFLALDVLTSLRLYRDDEPPQPAPAADDPPGQT